MRIVVFVVTLSDEARARVYDGLAGRSIIPCGWRYPTFTLPLTKAIILSQRSPSSLFVITMFKKVVSAVVSEILSPILNCRPLPFFCILWRDLTRAQCDQARCRVDVRSLLALMDHGVG